MKKIYEMTKEEILEAIKKYEARPKSNYNIRKISDLMWAHQSITRKERLARGETVNDAGYTGRLTKRGVG